MNVPATTNTKRTTSPLRLVLLLLLGQVALYAGACLALQSGEFSWGLYTVGDDWKQFFYPAAHRWLSTGSPYGGDFMGPPAAVLPALLLHGFSLETSHAIYTLVTMALTAFALWRFGGALGLNGRNRAGMLAVAAAFVPTWFLANGANLDALMLAGLLLGYSVRSKVARALLLAGTIVVKVYSAILVFVALRKRDLRLALLTCALCLLALLPFWRLLRQAAGLILLRTGIFKLGYNISPAALFYSALHGLGTVAWEAPYLLGWLLAFAYVLRRNADRDDAETLAMYAPFMIAAPFKVSAYAAVIALPTLALMLRQSQDRALRWYEWGVVAGFLLLDLHPEFIVAYGSYEFSSFATAKLVASLAGALGTTLLVAGCVARARTQQTEREPVGAAAG